VGECLRLRRRHQSHENLEQFLIIHHRGTVLFLVYSQLSNTNFQMSQNFVRCGDGYSNVRAQKFGAKIYFGAQGKSPDRARSLKPAAAAE
jgi:hypothetical protein